MALQGGYGFEASPAQKESLAKATAWLGGAKLPDNLQDKAFKLLLMARAGVSRGEMHNLMPAGTNRQLEPAFRKALRQPGRHQGIQPQKRVVDAVDLPILEAGSSCERVVLWQLGG